MASPFSKDSAFSIREKASVILEPIFMSSSLCPANFSPPGNDSLQFYVRLDVNGSSGDDKNLSLYFSTPKLNRKKVLVQWMISLLNAESQKKHSKTYIQTHSSKQRHFSGDFISRAIITRDKTLLTGGKLKVLVEAYVLKSEPEGLKPVPGVSGHVSTLSNDVQSLFDDRSFSDLTVVVGEKCFYVHKAILAARSIVLKEKIQALEAEPDEIHLEADADAFDLFLRYLYGDDCSNLNENAVKLIALAQQYNVSSLKAICEQVLGSSLTVDIFLSTLQLAIVNDADQLKACCVAYFKVNGKAILDTEKWRTCMLTITPDNFTIVKMLLSASTE